MLCFICRDCSEKSDEKMVHRMWRQDFKRSEWLLNHHPPEQFTRCFWQKSEKVLVWWFIYRAVLAIYFLTTWLISYFNAGRELESPEDTHKYWIFLTNWSYIAEAMYFILAFVIVLIKFAEERKKDFADGNHMAYMPWYYKLCWVLQNTVLPASIVVSAIFWFAVYDPDYNPLDLINFTTHLFNSIFMVMDFLLVAQPFRILHFYCPVVYSFTYVMFSLIYQLSGGTGTLGRVPIYGILDWFKPSRTVIICALAVAFLIMVHTTFWLLHKAKRGIRLKMEKRKAAKYEGGHENLGMEPPV